MGNRVVLLVFLIGFGAGMNFAAGVVTALRGDYLSVFMHAVIVFLMVCCVYMQTRPVANGK